MYLAFARFAQARFDEALALFETTLFRIPTAYAILAATYGQLGHADLVREYLAEFGEQTSNRIEDVGRTWFPAPEHLKLFLQGIAVA